MSIRRTMRGRTGMAAVAITTGLVLAVAGCGGGDDGGGDDEKSSAPAKKDDKNGDEGDGSSGGDDQSGGQEELAKVKGGKGGALTLTVTSAVREESGFATLKGTITNDGQSVAVLPGWASDETELKDNGLSMASATLVDKKGKKRYFILRDTKGRCLCTRFTGGFQQGQSTDWYAQFPAPPESAKSVDFQVADLPSASVELSGE